MDSWEHVEGMKVQALHSNQWEQEEVKLTSAAQLYCLHFQPHPPNNEVCQWSPILGSPASYLTTSLSLQPTLALHFSHLNETGEQDAGQPSPQMRRGGGSWDG